MKHHFRYETNVPEPKAIELGQKNVIYNDCLRKTIFYYYTGLQQGKNPGLKALYNKFLSSWNKANDIKEEPYLERDPKEGAHRARWGNKNYISKGYEAIQNFYGLNRQKQQAIIAVNHPYNININGVHIKGTFDLIREVLAPNGQSRIIEVVNFQTSKKKPDGFFLDNDMYSTFMHFAFLDTFKKPPVRFVMHYLTLNQEMVIERGLKDYKRMRRVLEGFTTSVNTIKPYPRQSFECLTCPFQEYCINTQFDD